MKNRPEDIKVCCDVKSKSKIRDFLDKQIYKIKHGNFRCPLCKESFTELSSLGAHLKDHCT